MHNEYIKRILNARVYDLAEETPVTEAVNLSKRLGSRIIIKREDLQPVFSFKIRGAYNKISSLTEEEKARGVVCASAGNHAQGVAMSAKHLGIRAVIVMPVITPDIKVNSVRDRGGEVVLQGDNFDEACRYAIELQKEEGMTFIHPYDDPDVIAGQGTVGMELLHQIKEDIDAIFVPVGGGGLISGIAVYSKYVRPGIKIIGVESEDSACLKAALESGKREILPEVGIFADGVAVAQIGEEPFNLASEYVDEVITVSTDEICAAIKDLFEDTRAIAEPAGAIGVAGLKKYVETYKVEDQTLVAVNSGANTSFGRLRHISERTELGSVKEALVAVTIPEEAGSFLQFCKDMGGYNVTEFNYRYGDKNSARIFVGVELKEGSKSRAELLKRLTSKGYEVIDLTENEMAKLHVRYMVGGHGMNVSERIFRFQFPEKPGALLKFLEAIGAQWSVTLFHYRNHAAAFGRVLMGIQAGADDKALSQKLEEIGYHFLEESENPAYRLFLT
jgi:threonine dehydratase